MRLVLYNHKSSNESQINTITKTHFNVSLIQRSEEGHVCEGVAQQVVQVAVHQLLAVLHLVRVEHPLDRPQPDVRWQPQPRNVKRHYYSDHRRSGIEKCFELIILI